MAEIKDYVMMYIENSDILPDAAEVIATDFEANMKSNLWAPNHGYDKGELHDSISTRSDVSEKIAIITGFYTAEHGKYVISGVRGKGEAKSGPIDFLNLGLEQTLEVYR